jgi:hypothetical protein
MSRSATALAQPKPITVEEWSELDDDIEGELVDGVLEKEEKLRMTKRYRYHRVT